MIIRYADPATTRQGRSRKEFKKSKQNAKYLGSRIKLLSSALRKNREFFDDKSIENMDGLIKQLHDLLRGNPELRKKHFSLVMAEQEADGEIFLTAPSKVLQDLGLGNGY